MTRSAQPAHPRRIAAGILTLVAVLALAACSPSAGALGTPASPAVTSEPSVDLPSADATPDVPPPSSSPSLAPSPTASPVAGGSGSPSQGPSSGPTATVRPTTTPSPAPSGTSIVRAYFVLGSFTSNEGLAPVLREVPKTQAVATAAMRALLAGPQGDELRARPAMYSAIPAGTRLLGLSIEDGIATVNLSREFESGGGSASILGRLAQVVFTLTQFPTVDAVRFQLDGVPVTVFGGEGVILDQPVDRSDYTDQLPAIFVDRPAWGASLGNPGTVSGLANVFEAAFQVQVLDAEGVVLVDRSVMATCGTGCWGTFDERVSYRVSKGQWGTLRVFNFSARDGTPENVTEYRVWLTPAS